MTLKTALTIILSSIANLVIVGLIIKVIPITGFLIFMLGMGSGVLLLAILFAIFLNKA